MRVTQARRIHTSVLLTQSASGVSLTGSVQLFLPQPEGPLRNLYKAGIFYQVSVRTRMLKSVGNFYKTLSQTEETPKRKVSTD